MSQFNVPNPGYPSSNSNPQQLASISNLLPQDGYHQGSGYNTLPPLQPSLGTQYRHSFNMSMPNSHGMSSSQLNGMGRPQYGHEEHSAPAFPSTLTNAAPSSSSAMAERPALAHHHSYPPIQNPTPYMQASLPQLAPSNFSQYDPAPQFSQSQAPSASAGLAPRDAPRGLSVVGSQGRRGVLPTVNGKPPSSPLEGPQSAGPAPGKNSDGKYPCKFCNRTYLHLKHLKRHHLRHTGERPYQCSLCHETFCRSDILKRHFAKCSIRRGNPAGVTHLQHAQAHLSHSSSHRQQSSIDSAVSTSSGPALAAQPSSSSYRTSWPQDPNALSSFSSSHSYAQSQSQRQGQNATQMPSNGLPTPANESTQSSRSSSVMRPASSSSDERKRFSEPNPSHAGLNSMNALGMEMTPPGTERNSASFTGMPGNGVIKQERYHSGGSATPQPVHAQPHTQPHPQSHPQGHPQAQQHAAQAPPPQHHHQHPQAHQQAQAQEFYAPIASHYHPSTHGQHPHLQYAAAAAAQHDHHAPNSYLPFSRGGGQPSLSYQHHMSSAHPGMASENWASCFTPAARDPNIMFTGVAEGPLRR